MKQETFLLKIAVFLIGIPILALCIFGLPSIAKDAAELYPAYWVYPLFAGMYASAIPFYIALFQALLLLSLIDRNDAFSERSVTALKHIKTCAVAITILYAACLPFFYLIADQDDAPGLIVIGLVIACASFVIAGFAAVLQKLLQNAIDLKSEHDLTV